MPRPPPPRQARFEGTGFGGTEGTEGTERASKTQTRSNGDKRDQRHRTTADDGPAIGRAVRFEGRPAPPELPNELALQLVHAGRPSIARRASAAASALQDPFSGCVPDRLLPYRLR